MRVRGVAAFALAVVLGGCSPGGGWGRLTGPALDLDPAEAQAYSNRQTELLKIFAVDVWGPGASLPDYGDPRWREVAEAGANFSKRQCEAFIDAIFKWHRAREAAKSELALLGSTATTVLPLLKATQQAIALTSATFTLASGTLVTVSDSVLFKVEPSGVRRIVERDQASYLIELQKGLYTTRAGAVRAIAGFHALCLPARLEAQVNESIGGSKAVVTAQPGPNEAPLVVQQEEVAALVLKYELDAAAQIIRAIVFPVGSTEPSDAGMALLARCMKAVGATSGEAPINDLLFQPAWAGKRAKVAACMTQKN